MGKFEYKSTCVDYNLLVTINSDERGEGTKFTKIVLVIEMCLSQGSVVAR